MDFLIGFISGMMIGGWIGLFVACLIMANKEEIFPKTPSQIFSEECEPYKLTRSTLSIKDLKPDITKMCPTKVLIDGKIVWDDEDGNDVIAGDFSTANSITEWILECHINADFDKLTLRMPSKIVTYEKERPQGEWKWKEYGNGKLGEVCYCSNCNHIRQLQAPETYNFCPNCGAEMKGGKEE